MSQSPEVVIDIHDIVAKYRDTTSKLGGTGQVPHKALGTWKIPRGS